MSKKMTFIHGQFRHKLEAAFALPNDGCQVAGVIFIIALYFYSYINIKQLIIKLLQSNFTATRLFAPWL